MIETRGLTVRYPEARALRDVDISIASGSFVLVGARSGGGKSTLAHALMGLIPQTMPAELTGQVSVDGLVPQQEGVARLARRAGLVFQNPATQMFSGTVREEVAFGPRNLGLPREEIARRVAYGLRAAGCSHLQDRAVRHLSGGEQQRVAIAAALAMRPAILILDEPTANLDREGMRSVARTLARLQRRDGLTLVVLEHRIEPFLPYADRLIWLAQGRVVADGDPAETLGRMRPSPPPPPPPDPSIGGPLVSVEEVTAGYEGRPVLEDCSLTLREGEFAALVGPNGAGKSTLARVLAGLLRPRRGRVSWHVNGRSRRVGLLQQNPVHQLVCDTVEEEIRFGPDNVGAGRSEEIEEVLAETDLLGLRRRATQALSVGQQQRTALAATLVLQPAVLILDEPTIGQDRGHLRRIMDLLSRLNRAGQTVLLITHDRRVVERYSSRVWEMTGGKVREAGHKRQAISNR